MHVRYWPKARRGQPCSHEVFFYFFCLSILGDYGKSIQSPSSNHSSEGRSKRLVLVGQGGKHQVWASNASFPIDLFYLIKDTVQYSYTFPSSTGKSWMRTLEKDAVRCRFEWLRKKEAESENALVTIPWQSKDACAGIFGAGSGNGIVQRPRQHEGNPHQNMRPLPRLWFAY